MLLRDSKIQSLYFVSPSIEILQYTIILGELALSECNIKTIFIKNFRNFIEKEINLDSKQILITGLNGAGKTSILEAISMLSAGKGIKNAKFHDQIRLDSNGWHLKFDMDSYIGSIIVEQSTTIENARRTIELNSRNIGPAELIKLSSIFWLTPQQNTLFQESPQDRRKFYDRVVYGFEHEHATNITQYEHYQKERFKILMMDYFDSAWVDAVEIKLTELALKISSSRIRLKYELQKVIDELDTPFPKIEIQIDSSLEKIIESENRMDLRIELIKNEYEKSRKKDIESHRTHFGALKADFSAIHKGKNIQAKFCSTGEQQSCLITLLLAQTDLFLKSMNKNPILLLDELFVHLDNKNKEYLTDYIKLNSIQTIVTTTEKELCSDFAKHAKLIGL